MFTLVFCCRCHWLITEFNIWFWITKIKSIHPFCDFLIKPPLIIVWQTSDILSWPIFLHTFQQYDNIMPIMNPEYVILGLMICLQDQDSLHVRRAFPRWLHSCFTLPLVIPDPNLQGGTHITPSGVLCYMKRIVQCDARCRQAVWVLTRLATPYSLPRWYV